MATAQSQAAIHPLLKTLHVFDETVNVLPPNKDARRDVSPSYLQSTITDLKCAQILATFVDDRLDSSDIIRDDGLNFTSLATQTEGYAAMDLEDLVARAVHQAAIRASQLSPSGDVRVSSPRYFNCCNLISSKNQPKLTTQDFASAQVDFVPLSLRDVKLQKSDVAWSDIGGNRLALSISMLTECPSLRVA